MSVLGCTGHQDIPEEAVEYVERGIAIELHARSCSAVVGACSLALGADQLFARLVLAEGGQLYAVVPCHDYVQAFDSAGRREFESLLSRATKVETLDYPEPSEVAFMAAGRRVVDLADELIAVWDGAEARGKGGTADVVRYAHERGTRVVVVWPPGTSR